jgi:hypothetical protein
VPVQPGYEAIVLYYLEHGLENGGFKMNVTKADLNDYHQSILDELNDENTIHEIEDIVMTDYQARSTANRGENDKELTWTLRVPTNLVVLCDAADLCNANTPVKAAMPTEVVAAVAEEAGK